MLAEQRRNQILDILAEKGAVTVSQLHQKLRVSQETIRRDITKLAADNRLRKTHGGALTMAQVEPELADRLSVNIEGKRAIGAAASDLWGLVGTVFSYHGSAALFIRIASSGSK